MSQSEPQDGERDSLPYLIRQAASLLMGGPVLSTQERRTYIGARLLAKLLEAQRKGGVLHALPSAQPEPPPPPRGCICPAEANLTCRSIACPRGGAAVISHAGAGGLP